MSGGSVRRFQPLAANNRVRFHIGSPEKDRKPSVVGFHLIHDVTSSAFSRRLQMQLADILLLQALSDQTLEEDTKLEYRLEIHRPGSCDDQDCLKIFTSAAPFLPLRIGDLLNASEWDGDGSGWKLLRVSNVEHVISEKPSIGIDPSGRIIHRALIYTEKVADNTETRNRPQAAL